jgi:hypothetical protein
MNKLLAGYTHMIVRTLTTQDSDISGVVAYVDICYGPGDDSSLANIPWRKLGPKQVGFASPTAVIAREGKKVAVPVFKGRLNEEICALCAQSIDTIKKQFGTLKSGHTYHVNEKGATDIKEVANG